MAAGINKRIPNPLWGVFGKRRNVGFYFHRVVTTTSGTVSTTLSDQAADSGVVVAKTGSEAGRYGLTLTSKHKKLLYLTAIPIGATDAAYGAASLGLPVIARNDAVATAGTVDLQFVAGDTNWSDAEVADGASFMIVVVVENG